MRQNKILLRVSTALIPFAFGCIVWPQASSPSDPQAPNPQMLQQFAQNAAQLHGYQWIETTTVSIQGHTQPAQKAMCHFDSDGTLVRTPLNPQQNAQQQMKGGPLMQKMEAKKMGEVKEEMTQVHEVAAMYLPLNPEKLQEAMQNNQADMQGNGAGGNAINVSGYAKSGDQLTLNLSPTTQQIQSISVKTFLSEPDEPLNIVLQFAKLDDGTTYPSVTTIVAPSKNISITSVSSDFSKPVQ
jgi:hypothetical protein